MELQNSVDFLLFDSILSDNFVLIMYFSMALILNPRSLFSIETIQAEFRQLIILAFSSSYV